MSSAVSEEWKVSKAFATPEIDRDGAWHIFHDKFLCLVSNIESMSVDYIKAFGMPTCGDPTKDRQTAHELVSRMLTINEMVEYFKKGTTVRVHNVKDTKIIYQHISDHLAAWRSKLNDGFHTRGAPIDDLLVLDKLATVVYAYAQPLFTTQYVESVMARQMVGIMRFNRDNILAPPKVESTTVNGVVEEMVEDRPQRVSMADVFASRLAAGAPKWSK